MIKVHGIVNCDTVRKARDWLGQHGVEYEFVDFRKTPPSSAVLARWCAVLGWEMLVNRRGTTWRRLDAADRARVVDAPSAIEALLAHPSAIKRPVVETGDAVIVGFDSADWERRFSPRP